MEIDGSKVEIDGDIGRASTLPGCFSRDERGRYSAKREAGVHHFHRLLAAALEDGG